MVKILRGVVKNFGYIAYAYEPSQLGQKLEGRRVPVGYVQVTKSYMFYNPITKKLIVSRDITLYEQGVWNWSSETRRYVSTGLTYH